MCHTTTHLPVLRLISKDDLLQEDMGLAIAGERSGAGKTTVTLALLASLCDRSLNVQSFKVGPDYIDPMFHQQVTGCPCRNLDPVLTSETYVQQCFAHHSQNAPYALVEGVMGLFDGAGAQDWASTAHIARLLRLPILLVLDCGRLSRSAAAIVHGYRSFDPHLQIAGLVLNRVGSDRHLEVLKTALDPLQIPILGVLRRETAIALPSRHLGLVPTEELADFGTTIAKLAHLGNTSFDWEHLLPLLQTQPSTTNHEPLTPNNEPLTRNHEPIRIAVARDRAFSFYYADNLDLLRQLGAELLFWSPLRDRTLPHGTQGLYFGGGFPEMFPEALADNLPGRQAVCTAIQSGMPAYAECGGLMYLSQAITDFEQNTWPMVGILPTTTRMAKRLTLGYRQAIALNDSPLMPADTIVWGHEFHRSCLTAPPQVPLYTTWRYDQHRSESGQPEGWQQQQLHASYIHLHFGATPELPQRFLHRCAQGHGE